MDIVNYGLREKYDQLKRFGDRLADMKTMIDWDRIKPLLSDLYSNDTERGGRPNFDPILMVKVLFLQSTYGVVDEAMEIELYSNIRFINFLDYPETVPDARTIWLFRERLSENHLDNRKQQRGLKRIRRRKIERGRGKTLKREDQRTDHGQ